MRTPRTTEGLYSRLYYNMGFASKYHTETWIPVVGKDGKSVFIQITHQPMACDLSDLSIPYGPDGMCVPGVGYMMDDRSLSPAMLSRSHNVSFQVVNGNQMQVCMQAGSLVDNMFDQEAVDNLHYIVDQIEDGSAFANGKPPGHF